MEKIQKFGMTFQRVFLQDRIEHHVRWVQFQELKSKHCTTRLAKRSEQFSFANTLVKMCKLNDKTNMNKTSKYKIP